jgi:hypothetical protein
MHEISDLELVEDRNGRPRVGWVCACGGRGSGANQRAALSGFKRHVRSAARKSDW